MLGQSRKNATKRDKEEKKERGMRSLTVTQIIGGNQRILFKIVRPQHKTVKDIRELRAS